MLWIPRTDAPLLIHPQVKDVNGFRAVPLGGAGLYRGPNLLVDGDMEDPGVGAWTAVAAALTKQATDPAEGLRYLRVTATSLPSAGSARQVCMVSGNTYRITGYARGDGSGVKPRIYAGFWIFKGTASTAWQAFDVTFVPTDNTLRLYVYAAPANGNYTEFDGLYLSEE